MFVQDLLFCLTAVVLLGLILMDSNRIHLMKVSMYRERDDFATLISEINRVRAAYPWSQKVYDASKLDHVYLIRKANKFVGFIEAEIVDQDLTSKRPVSLYLHELHIAQSMQGQGTGYAVLRALLQKAIPIEMVVANENTAMLALLEKLNAKVKYSGKDVCTMVL